MPPIYSSVYQNFIRQGLSKSINYGYAQSFVAATHPHLLHSQNRPSFARRNSTRFGRLHALQVQAAFHTDRQTSGLSADHRHERGASHGGLDAYYEALTQQEAEDPDKEWTQFEFQKRIEWKPSPAAILLGEPRQTDDYVADDLGDVESHHESEGLRALTPEDQAALAHIDAALEAEILLRNRLESVEGSTLSASAPGSAVASPAASRPRTPPANIALPASPPPVDPQSQTYADHLGSLTRASRYAEIPAVFEAMLVAGVRPLPSAYNALLVAAIQLPSEKTEVVSKALDVYADMLRRKVAPDAETYNILVGLLAARSLEVSSLKKNLEDMRVRFGGMDEAGRFMFASHELEHAILSEDDRLGLAVKLFDASVVASKADFSPETYYEIIAACAATGRVGDMLRLFEHMENNGTTPYAAVFPAMITAFAASGDLVSAVECYNEYRDLAIADDQGQQTVLERLDAQVYAAVINAYVICDKIEGAMKFYHKIVSEYGASAAAINDAIVMGGFVQGFLDRGIYQQALAWAQSVESATRATAMSRVATFAADRGDRVTAVGAFANIPAGFADVATPSAALLAMSVRDGDVASATRYWHILASPDVAPSSALIEPTAMYAIALIGSGQVVEGLVQSELMFHRISTAGTEHQQPQLADEIEEATEFIARFMETRGIVDPRTVASPVPSLPVSSSFVSSPYSSTPTVSTLEDTFDPYARNTDFKGSSLISDDLEGGHGRKGPRLNEALARFRNIRRAGRHPRYITYAKLISAASREGKLDLCNDLLAMARSDMPLLPQYAVVRYGWSSILDAMIGACLNAGHRDLAEKFHQELLEMGATPTANTYGLYITTLKESTKTFDEASEAVKIFHRAKAEGVEPSSFLYNALIGKLGKARRIDDCLLYFAEMRALGIKPTSVTYGTVVNALCRVSDEKFAEELFDEMESMPNYKARPAPYNSMMQFFLTTKRDKSKVLAYYERMIARGISPTSHTFKLLMDSHASLEPVDMVAAEQVLDKIRAAGLRPDPVHHASLIHARGCVQHDMDGAREVFDKVLSDRSISVNASVFQALFEAMVANHRVEDTETILKTMKSRGVEMTPYIANTLIHGWASQKNIDKARSIYDMVGRNKREPSTYEAMTRGFLAVEDRESAKGVVTEMLSRGYPSAVVNKVLELLGGAEESSAPIAA